MPNIIVLIGRVLDPSGIVFNRRAGRLFVNREEYLLQPADRCALEAALRIKEAGRPKGSPAAEVVALPRTLLPDDDVLRQAVATGADRAIHLVGAGGYTGGAGEYTGFANADDALMARVLAAVVERLGGADLVLTGATTLDTGQGQLGPRLAEALGWPQIVDAWHVEAVDGRVRAVRKEKDGFVAVEADLPAVVTVLPGVLKPRYPDGARLINVYRGVKEMANALERWDVADLMEAQALKPLIERRGQEFPPERERGARVSGTPAQMAQTVAEALGQRVRR